MLLWEKRRSSRDKAPTVWAQETSLYNDLYYTLNWRIEQMMAKDLLNISCQAFSITSLFLPRFMFCLLSLNAGGSKCTCLLPSNVQMRYCNSPILSIIYLYIHQYTCQHSLVVIPNITKQKHGFISCERGKIFMLARTSNIRSVFLKDALRQKKYIFHFYFSIAQ